MLNGEICIPLMEQYLEKILQELLDSQVFLSEAKGRGLMMIEWAPQPNDSDLLLS